MPLPRSSVTAMSTPPRPTRPSPPALPVYTAAQYAAVRALTDGFLQTEGRAVTAAGLAKVAEILHTYTPTHLHDQIDGVAWIHGATSLLTVAMTRLIADGFLSTARPPRGDAGDAGDLSRIRTAKKEARPPFRPLTKGSV